MSHTPVRLAYKVFDPEDGLKENLSPVIFLHGLTASKEHWQDIPQIIADGTKRRAYALDARNHGDSAHTDVFNFDVISEDLFNFMDSMKIRKAILVGHSMGGMTAIKAALDKPERVEKIVVEDMFVRKCPSELINMVYGFICLVEKHLKTLPPELSQEEAMKVLFENVVKEASEALGNTFSLPCKRIPVLPMARDEDGRYVYKSNMEVIKKALVNQDTLMSEREGTFHGPACFIYGKLSQFNVIQDKDHINQHFPNAEFVGLEASHDVHTDVPEEFVETVLKFLS